MSSDRSRTSDDLPRQYKAVVMQQGRVILDRDFNALQEIVDGLASANALEAIGPCGTSDNGFEITIPGSNTSSSPSASTPLPPDFLIAPGTMYVGGQRVVLPPPGPWSYFQQPGWDDPLDPQPPTGSPTPSSTEYVYLHVYEQEVGAVEDPDLLDVALGGPDTTQRVRLMSRVHRTPSLGTDSATALGRALSDLEKKGLVLDPSTMRLRRLVQLQVSLETEPPSSSPCDSVVKGGYLGPDNQLIRIQLADNPTGTGPSLVWGYDNASFIYRVQLTDPQSVQLLQFPVDDFHAPQPRQVVEVLRSALSLDGAAGAAARPATARHVARPTGFLTTVSEYNRANNSVTLSSPVPSSFTGDKNPLFLRVWQGQQAFTPSQPLTLIDPVSQLPLGIQVTITGSTGGVVSRGAFWMIAVRPGTPQAIYPERFLNSPQAPDGPREWFCPLALIGWLGQGSASVPAFSAPAHITDCRQKFNNLVTLTSRAWEDQVNVTGVFTQGSPHTQLTNGVRLRTNDLAQGLLVFLNHNVDPSSVTQATCAVSLDLPYPPGSQSKSQPFAFQRVVLSGNVTALDPATMVWSPPSLASAWEPQLEALLPQVNFGSRWDTFPPPSPALAIWSYLPDASIELKSTGPLPVTSTTLTAINLQLVSREMKGIRAVVQGRSSGMAPEVCGIIFNYDNSLGVESYWVLAISPLPFAASSTPVVSLSKFVQSTTTPIAFSASSLPLQTAPGQKIEFHIGQAQSSGQPLTFSVSVSGGAPIPVTFSSTNVPQSLMPNTRVGLYVSFTPAIASALLQVDFSRLEIEHDGGTQVILPDDFRSQAFLTIKRDYLQPDTTASNPTPPRNLLPSPRSDYSLWFWLVPSAAPAQQGLQVSIPPGH